MSCLIRFEEVIHFSEIGIWSCGARRDCFGGQLLALRPQGAQDQVGTGDGMLDLVASLIVGYRLAQNLFAAQVSINGNHFSARPGGIAFCDADRAYHFE